jgi:hypothetical protein
MALQWNHRAAACADDTRAGLDALIRPGLQRAFPLPRDDNERFQQLLEALAQRRTIARDQLA